MNLGTSEVISEIVYSSNRMFQLIKKGSKWRPTSEFGVLSWLVGPLEGITSYSRVKLHCEPNERNVVNERFV